MAWYDGHKLEDEMGFWNTFPLYCYKCGRILKNDKTCAGGCK